jgi:diguanylate cyclase (GGDEF)-like protein
MLVDEVRPYDTVVRTGGEEFLVICPTIDAIGARALAERLCAATPLRCAAALSGGVRQTVSIGIAVYPEAADYADGLVRKADGALYEAKRAGRNTVVLAGADERAGDW